VWVGPWGVCTICTETCTETLGAATDVLGATRLAWPGSRGIERHSWRKMFHVEHRNRFHKPLTEKVRPPVSGSGRHTLAADGQGGVKDGLEVRPTCRPSPAPIMPAPASPRCVRRL